MFTFGRNRNTRKNKAYFERCCGNDASEFLCKSKGHKFYDAKAVELVEKIDYDFTDATKDSLMSYGVIARTLVFDELVKAFIDENPNCTVVNIACGLDTRFYRMDNGKITWYNIDLPETIEVRNQIFSESDRVSNIGISATDPTWAKEIKVHGNMLFIIEGLSMYLTRKDNAQMLRIIRENFDSAYVVSGKKVGIERKCRKVHTKNRSKIHIWSGYF